MENRKSQKKKKPSKTPPQDIKKNQEGILDLRHIVTEIKKNHTVRAEEHTGNDRGKSKPNKRLTNYPIWAIKRKKLIEK